MTYKQLIKCIIKSEFINTSDVCPPDEATVKCGDEYKAGECDKCWDDFLHNRYKKYKG